MGERESTTWLRVMTAAVASVGLLAVGCAGEAPPHRASGPLPARLHGLALAESRSGEDAAAAIGRLHDRNVAPPESHIGFYGEEPTQLALYKSLFASAEAAQTQLEAMSTSIGAGSSGYGHHTQFEVGETDVHAVFGHGQAHYFYAHGRELVWLAAPPAMARVVLAEVLGVRTARIPELLSGPPVPGTPPD